MNVRNERQPVIGPAGGRRALLEIQQRVTMRLPHLRWVLLTLALLLGSAAVAWAGMTFGTITGPACSGAGCTFTIQVNTMSNPDKQICLEYATTAFNNQCSSGGSGGSTTTVVRCSCTAPACNSGTGVGTWVCDGPAVGPQTYYWALGSWTAGGGWNCGAEATYAGCGTISPLAVELASFTAQASADGVTLAWETVSETANAGFNVYRGAAATGPWQRLNAALIPAAAPGSSAGHAYAWTDASGGPGQRYWYLLEDVALDGAATRHGPVALAPLAPNAVGLAGSPAATAAAISPAWAGLAALAWAGLAGAGLRRRRRG
jgi:hypothetical protein